ncbi:MAG: aveG [Clostridiaceae bacterium]|jgi:surfactin synthase thioesterase subunit|nr:aveG [Clostridiaceae bacterium]
MKKIKLFCIPYAGGSATVYEKWKKKVNDKIEVIPIEFAGRGARSREKLYDSIEEAVDDLYKAIVSKLDKCDEYAIFGHSMGSIITLELYYKLVEMNFKEPKHIFVSGGEAPPIKRRPIICHDLPDKEFREQISIYSDAPSIIFENAKLYNYFIPILKSDFKIMELYNYKEKEHKINCNVTALAGIYDASITIDDVIEWQRHTSKVFKFYTFEGGHFFINEKLDEVIEIINLSLEDTI